MFYDKIKIALYMQVMSKGKVKAVAEQSKYKSAVFDRLHHQDGVGVTDKR